MGYISLTLCKKKLFQIQLVFEIAHKRWRSGIVGATISIKRGPSGWSGSSQNAWHWNGSRHLWRKTVKADYSYEYSYKFVVSKVMNLLLIVKCIQLEFIQSLIKVMSRSTPSVWLDKLKKYIVYELNSYGLPAEKSVM